MIEPHKTLTEKVTEIIPDIITEIIPDILSDINIRKITISPTEPVNPNIGDLWIDTNE